MPHSREGLSASSRRRLLNSLFLWLTALFYPAETSTCLCPCSSSPSPGSPFSKIANNPWHCDPPGHSSGTSVPTQVVRVITVPTLRWLLRRTWAHRLSSSTIFASITSIATISVSPPRDSQLLCRDPLGVLRCCCAALRCNPVPKALSWSYSKGRYELAEL